MHSPTKARHNQKPLNKTEDENTNIVYFYDKFSYRIVGH